MIIIWRGYGLIVPALFALITFSLTALSHYIASEMSVEVIKSSLAITGVLLWFIGKYLMQLDTVVINDANGKQVVKRKRDHTFYFIPIKYWGTTMVILSIALVVVGILKG